jgi:hypothetical protein
MNFTIFSSVLFAFATIALYAIPSNALSHPVDLKSADVDRHAAKIAKYVYDCIYVSKKHRLTLPCKLFGKEKI